MLWTVLSCVLAAAAAVSSAPVREVGSEMVCINNRLYAHSWSAQLPPDSSISRIDQADGIRGVDCDVDQSTLRLTFDSEVNALKWTASVTFGEGFITSNNKFLCNGTLIIRRAVSHIGMSSGENGDHHVEMRAPRARYDEVWEDAVISLLPMNKPCSAVDSVAIDRHICLGVNADASCTAAAAPYVLYQNELITVTCQNCFMAFSSDIMFSLEIHGFKMTTFQAGYANSTLAGELLLKIVATKDWSVGVDKTLPLIQPKNVIDLFTAGLPLRLWFEIPVELQASAQATATAEAQIGAKFDWFLGDNLLKWTPDTHWTHITPKPSFNWTTIAPTGDASFDATTTVSIRPSFIFHADNFWNTAVTMLPTVSYVAHADTTTKKLCVKGTFDAILLLESKLEVNIPWLNVNIDKTYGPKTYYDSGTLDIGDWCS
jgi:hypothetical protein